jgi:outer membrane protein OmpA-like peptidoglycan-associated protein
MGKAFKKVFVPIAVIALLALGTACATKQMVIEQVSALDKKVEGVEASVEENQKRIREHDERLASIGTLVGQYDAQFKAVDGKINDVRRAAQGKLLYQETIRNKDARFKFDSAALSPEIKMALDAFAQRLIAENRGIFLEIQGHTDSTGPEEWNLILGRKRAEAVLEYLYKQHHIPLHRMQVISLGSSNPVGDNKKADGRALNRRVEVLVYE